MNKKLTAKKAIWDFLENYDLNDAIFTAKLLHAKENNEESLFLLATSYYRAGKIAETLTLLEQPNLTSSRTKFLLLKCYVDLERFGEAKMVLLRDYEGERTLSETIHKVYGVKTGYVLQIIGNMYYEAKRYSLAQRFFLESLEFNPTLWSSFYKIDTTTCKINIENIFNINRYLKYNCEVGIPAASGTKRKTGPWMTVEELLMKNNTTSQQLKNELLAVRKRGGNKKPSTYKSLKLKIKISAIAKKPHDEGNTDVVDDSVPKLDNANEVSSSNLKLTELTQNLGMSVEKLLSLFKELGLVHCYLLDNKYQETMDAFNNLSVSHKYSTGTLCQIGEVCSRLNILALLASRRTGGAPNARV